MKCLLWSTNKSLLNGIVYNRKINTANSQILRQINQLDRNQVTEFISMQMGLEMSLLGAIVIYWQIKLFFTSILN